MVDKFNNTGFYDTIKSNAKNHRNFLEKSRPNFPDGL